MESIHKRIKRLRDAKGFTQTDLATASGVKYQSVQDWEREGGTAPSRKRQPIVAKFLGVSTHELLTGEAKVSPEDQLPAVEALLLEHFRGLAEEQKRELLRELRALARANQISQRGLDLKSIGVAADKSVEDAYGSVPGPKPRSHPVLRKGRARRGMGHSGDPDVE